MTYFGKDDAGVSASKVTRYYCDVHGVFEVSRWPENDRQIYDKCKKHCDDFHKGIINRY